MTSPDPNKHYRGSRKHVLDWTAEPSFLAQLADAGRPAPIEFAASSLCMPRGRTAPAEARLETFGPRWLPNHPAWPALRQWWLKDWKNACHFGA